MIQRHTTHRGWSSTHRLARFSPAIADSDPQPAKHPCDASPPANGAGRPDWGLMAVWGFVLSAFAALAFVIYVLWAKCGGT